ncbi:hypothetical protein GCM10027317_04120 [Massilia agri]
MCEPFLEAAGPAKFFQCRAGLARRKRSKKNADGLAGVCVGRRLAPREEGCRRAGESLAYFSRRVRLATMAMTRDRPPT